MGSNTKIEWTDATWNPIIGCSRVSEGCRNCYAEGIAGRFGQGKPTVYSGLTQIVNGRAVWTGKIKETKQLLQPMSWRKPKRVFVNSMSDMFHENVTVQQMDKIFAVMALNPQHTFQVLTKRPELMRSYLSSLYSRPSTRYRISRVADGIQTGGAHTPEWLRNHAYQPGSDQSPPLPNLWLGVSTENQKAADERIPELMITPAAVRFLSCEPLLEEIDLWTFLYTGVGGSRFNRLHWVICGGESGPHARPMREHWATSLRDQCQKAEIPFFFKQWGEWVPTEDPKVAQARGIRLEDCMSYVGKKAAGSLLDGREWKQFPEGK